MKNEIRYEARRLRKQGKSVKEIALALKVSRSSVSLWVRDIELTEEQTQVLKDRQRLWGAQNSGAHVNRDKAQQRRAIAQETGRLKAKENNALHLAGCMLYWAEGAKSRNNVNFVNSDPNMSTLLFVFCGKNLKCKILNLSFIFIPIQRMPVKFNVSNNIG